MNRDKIEDVKDAALEKAAQPLRIKLPLWAWGLAALALVVIGAVWLG